MAFDDMKNMFYLVIYLNLGFALLNVVGISPIHVVIPELNIDLTEELQTNTDDFMNEFKNMDGVFGTLSSTLFIVVKGIYILLDFMGIIFLGIPSILNAVGVPYSIAALLTTVLYAPVMYDFGTKLLRIS